MNLLVLLTVIAAPADDSQRYLEAAEASFAHGDVENARKEIDQAITADPQNPDALLAGARMARRTGNPERAVELLNQILKLDQYDDEARYELVLAQAELGDRTAATATVDSLLARAPQHDAGLAARAAITSGDKVNGTDTGGFRPVARVGLGASYDSNVLLASSAVVASSDKGTPTIDVDAAAGFTLGRKSQLNGARPFVLLARLTNQNSTSGNSALHNFVPSTVGVIALAQQRAGDFQLAFDGRYNELFVDGFSEHVQRSFAPSVWAARVFGINTLRLLGGLEYRNNDRDAGGAVGSGNSFAGRDNITYEAAIRDTLNLHPVQLAIDIRGSINKGVGAGSEADNASLVGFKEAGGFVYAWAPIVKTLSAFALAEVIGRKFDSNTQRGEITYRGQAGARYGIDAFELHAEYTYMNNDSRGEDSQRSFTRHVVSGGVRYWYD